MSEPIQQERSGLGRGELGGVITQELAAARFIDMHTHLYPPSFGSRVLRGIDELMTYHYLEAEFFRVSRWTPARYWQLTQPERADAIWRTLFVEATPISEAARGILAILKSFHLSTNAPVLGEAREFFAAQDAETHTARVLEMAGVDQIVMTNDPLDPAEVEKWRVSPQTDSRYRAALRLDRILNEWPAHWQQLAAQGYRVNKNATGESGSEIRRFLSHWSERMAPVYMAVSLPDTFTYPNDDISSRLLTDVVLPLCRETDVPLSLMIGVRRQVNPALRLAGDAAGQADLRFLERLCCEFPDNRFLISLLSRENQHQLCVYARKFSNLMPFGCWWFVNQPSIVEEITRERLEMLGLSFIPQHSDSRVLEQLIYKWQDARRTLAPILSRQYELLSEQGRTITRIGIRRDIVRLFRDNFERFSGPNGQRGPSGAMA